MIRSAFRGPSLTFTALAAAVALAGCMQEARTDPALASAETDSRQCFPVSAVRGFGEGPQDNQITVEVGREHYLMETFGPCPDLNWSWALAFDTSPGSFICGGTNVDILIPDPEVGPGRCPVRMVRKLSEAEEAELGL